MISVLAPPSAGTRRSPWKKHSPIRKRVHQVRGEEAGMSQKQSEEAGCKDMPPVTTGTELSGQPRGRGGKAKLDSYGVINARRRTTTSRVVLFGDQVRSHERIRRSLA